MVIRIGTCSLALEPLQHMIDSIAKFLGSGFVIPTLLLLAATWASKFLLDLHVSSRQSRKDFLDVWRGIDLNDAVLVETAVRHLWGAYLPADVIRIVHRQPFPSRALRRLAAIWDHVDYDATALAIRLNARWKERTGRRWAAVWGYTLVYFVAGTVSLYLARQVVLKQPSDPSAWVLAALTVTSGLLAVVSLGRADGLKSLDESSLEMVAVFNRHLAAADPSRSAMDPPHAASDMHVRGSAGDAAVCSTHPPVGEFKTLDPGPTVDVLESGPSANWTRDHDASP